MSDNWKMVPLIEAATLQRGFDLPVQHRVSGDVPVFAANGPVGTHNEPKVQGPGVVTGRSGTIGKVHYVDCDYWPLNTSLFVNDFHGNHPKFVFYLLSQLRLERFYEGTGVPTLNRNNIHGVEVPLPPLSEQKRIADILDKADAIRRKRQDCISNFDLLSDSLFNQLSRDCHIQPQSVDVLLDSQVLLVHKDGNFGGSYPRKHEFGSDGVPFLSAKHVSPDGTLSKEDVPRLNEAKARTLPFGWIERGDVLLAHNATVGPVALYSGDYEEALIGTSLTCYRPNSSFLKSEFLFAALRGSHFQRQLAKEMSQTTRNQVPITAQRKLTLHVPPLEQQQFFSEQLSAIRTLRTKHVKAGNDANTLFNSLVQRAFKGEL